MLESSEEICLLDNILHLQFRITEYLQTSWTDKRLVTHYLLNFKFKLARVDLDRLASSVFLV